MVNKTVMAIEDSLFEHETDCVMLWIKKELLIQNFARVTDI